VEQMLRLAGACSNIVRFGFVGTALVAGNRSGIIKEDEFEHSAGFKNTYEQSKYEAEQLVRSHANNLPIVIFRPPLIAPPHADERTSRGHTNALSLGASLVAQGDIHFLPGVAQSVVDIVDPEIAAEKIVKLLFKPTLAHMVYHITNGEHAPTVEVIRSMIEKKLKRSLSLDFCGSMAEYNERVRHIPWHKFRARYAHKKIRSFISELAYPKVYDNSRTLAELHLDRLGPDPTVVINELLK